MISRLEERLRRFQMSPRGEHFAGSVLTVAVVGTAYAATYAVIRFAAMLSPYLETFVIILFTYFIVATRDLHDESKPVVDALKEEDTQRASLHLSRIVGRDTEGLTGKEILRATLETISENVSDGVVAPLFYLFLGGAPLAMAYKAVNTLDSMVGYRNERYIHFGWASAKCDDALNFIPARITGGLIVVSAFFSGKDWKGSWRVMRRDSRKHPSPNSAIPEAAAAGALGVRLGGPATYGGAPSLRPLIGDDLEEIDLSHYSSMITLLYVSSLIMAVSVLSGLLLMHWKAHGTIPLF
jgi:adenosylcobinamide-phosphate synthase